MTTGIWGIGEITTFPYGKYYILILVFWAFLWILINIVAKVVGVLQTRVKSLERESVQEVFTKLRALSNRAFPVLFAISCFGITVGILAGNSRAPIADTVISTVLAVYGGLAAYWFTKTAGMNRVITSLSLIVFSVLVLYGIHVGALQRVKSEKEQRHFEEKIMRLQSDLRKEEYRQKVRTDLKSEEAKKVISKE